MKKTEKQIYDEAMAELDAKPKRIPYSAYAPGEKTGKQIYDEYMDDLRKKPDVVPKSNYAPGEKTGLQIYNEAMDKMNEDYKRRKKLHTGGHIHPTIIGSTWHSKLFIHGPRLKDPKLFSEFRLGKITSEGSRVVLGKNKRTHKWEAQSTLKPKGKGWHRDWARHAKARMKAWKK